MCVSSIDGVNGWLSRTLHWAALRATQSVDRAVQSMQGMIRTLRSSLEEEWGLELEEVHSIWPWIATHAGFLLTRFEVGRDGKPRTKDSATVQDMMFAEGIWRGPIGKITCMWEDGIYLGAKATTGATIVGKHRRRVAHEDGQEEAGRRTMGTEQLDQDLRSSLAQERGRPRGDGEKLR